ncbi:peroxidase family protein [uncultured Roseovarius sp.]|uniref:peroxidase family protein n=1 Tax=uncultured Roseovarius sp. TaxID=293344 RepID=UPI00260AC7DF|nr:peroxidase family protein [uncultured Roseovarius sp.]
MKSLGAKFAEIVQAIGSFFKSAALLTLRFVADFIFRLIDLVLPLIKIAHFVRNKLPGFWNWLTRQDWFKRLISRRTFRKFAGAAPARPHQFTMAQDYTTWYGFVDRSYTGRHLPPRRASNLPDPDALTNLFLRDETDGQTDCTRSTVLFAAFAQWFTDSFLRTAHAMEFDAKNNVIRDGSDAIIRKEGRATRNTSNHEIDLCQIYGLTQDQTNLLRCDDDENRGCLKFQDGEDGEYPCFLLSGKPTALDPKDPKKNGQLRIRREFKNLHPDERIIRSIFSKAGHNKKGYETIFAVGLEHGNATIGNSLMNTIFLREHNRIARLIAGQHTDWDSDRVFETTRNVMTVLLLKIVISDYIRHISPMNLPLEFQPGLAEKENWYRTNRISIEFNLLYRWHALVPDEMSFMPNPKDPVAFLHNNDWLMQTGVGKAVDLFSKEVAGRITLGNTPRFLGPVKRDTISLMRDANLATYNAYRERFSLPKAHSYEDITDDKNMISELKALYGENVDNLEWYVGLMAEKHGTDMIMGDLLLTMVAHDAFTQALTNPLLANEVFRPETFSPVGWKVINETSKLEHIVQRVVGGAEPVTCTFSHATR